MRSELQALKEDLFKEIKSIKVRVSQIEDTQKSTHPAGPAGSASKRLKNDESDINKGKGENLFADTIKVNFTNKIPIKRDKRNQNATRTEDSNF